MISTPIQNEANRTSVIRTITRALGLALLLPWPALAQSQPDLEAQSFQAPSSIGASDPVWVAWTVRNRGNADAQPSWIDTIYLSTNSVWEPQDQCLGQFSRSYPLAAGTSYAQYQAVGPLRVAPGNYYLILRVDDGGAVAESNETNNVLAQPIHVAAPDLTPTALTVLAIAAISQPIQVVWTVLNQGDGAALATWYDTLYLSKNQRLDAAAIRLGDFGRSFVTPAGGNYVQVQSVSLPAVPAGSYFLILQTDSANSLTESVETNNIRVAAITIGAPDLVPDQVKMTNSFGIGQRVEVSWVVRNQGQTVAPGGWYESLFLSSDQNWDPQDIQLASVSRSLPLGPGASYLVTAAFNAPNVPAGRYNVILRIDHNNNVVEANESNNAVVIPVSVVLPNLAVVDFQCPTAALPGQTVQLAWHVRNVGQGPVLPSWTDMVRFSTDQGWDDSDAVLAQPAYDLAVPSQGGYLQVAAITLPMVAPTNYFLILRVDAYGQVYEANKGDNDRVVPIVIAGPDLRVEGVSAPAAALAGSTIQVAWNVTNVGNGKAVGTWTDGIYLSSDLSGGGGTPLLAQFNADASLEAGANYSMSGLVNLPTDPNAYIEVIPGAFLSSIAAPNSLGAITWEYWTGIGGANVSDLTNNPSFPGNPSGTGLRTSFEGPLNWADNYGSRLRGYLHPPVSGAYSLWIAGDDTCELWLSSDANATNKVLVAQVPSAVGWRQWTAYADQHSAPINLLAGKKYYIEVLHKEQWGGGDHISVGWQLPAGATRYLLVGADINNNVTESTETNNFAGIPFTLGDPAAAPANLATRVGDGQVTLSWAPVSGATGYNLYFTTNFPLLRASAKLIAGVSSPFTHTNLVNGATYWYAVAAVTAAGEGSLSSVTTATPAAAGRPAADLAPVALVTPDRLELKGTVAVSWQVINQGTLDASPSWTDELYLSRDQTLDASDTLLASWNQTLGILVGGKYLARVSVTLPAVTPGVYYLIVRVDRDGNITEYNRANNTLAARLEITAPDLVPITMESPATINVGQLAMVAFVVTNQGSGLAALPWTDELYLSPDAKLDQTDLRLASIGASLPVHAGQGYIWWSEFTVPRLKPGTYFLLAKTDVGDIVFESVETNNVLAQSVTLVAPDLAATSLTVPTNATVGQMIEVSWTVQNLGAGDAGGTWTDALYLSTDTTLDPTDLRLTTADHSGPLGPTNFYSATASVTLPALPQGSYYLILRSDYTSSTFDTVRANNDRAVGIQIRAPDLVVAAASAPATVTFNQPFEVLCTITNRGAGAATTSWTDAIYLSTDSTSSPEDIRLGSISHSDPLAGGASYAILFNVSSPLVAPGDYFLIVRADDVNSLIESDESNNERAVAIHIAAPDLVPTALQTGVPGSSGGGTDSLRITRLVPKPDGTVQVAWTGATTGIQVLYSPTLKPVLWEAKGLLTNGTNTTLSATGNGKSGFYRLLLPAASPSSGPLMVLAKQRVDVTWQVANSGGGDAPPAWTDKLYLSTDNHWDPADVPLVAITRGSRLAAGNSYAASANVQIPLVSAGAYYLLVRADDGSNVYEANEDNNQLALPIIVGAPDLAPVTLASATTRSQGTALHFDGASDFVSVSNSPSLHSERNLTVSGWFKPDSLYNAYSSSQALFWKGNPNDCSTGCENREYALWYYPDGHLHFTSTPVSRIGVGQLELDSPAVLAPGRWFHFAAVISSDGGYMRLYLNGSLVAERAYDASGIRTTTGPLHLGVGTGNDYFAGTLDAVRVWNVARTEEQIRQEMTQQLGPSEPGLAAYWGFDEGMGMTTLDLTTNQNVASLGAGSLANAPRWDPTGAPVLDLQSATNAAVAASTGELWLSWGVTNQGSGTALPSWTDAVYSSTDTNLDFGDTLLGQFSRNYPLAPGASYQRLMAVRLPQVALGNYFVIVKADSGAALFEVSTTNNCRVLPLTVTAPDLAPTALTGGRFTPSGTALSFDGSDDYVSINVKDPESEATHELWFSATTPNGGLFAAITPNWSCDRTIYLWNGQIGARLWQDETIGAPGLNLADGQWHHVAHVFGRSIGGQRLYVDGQLVATGIKSESDLVQQTGVVIGWSGDARPGCFSGLIDEVRVWRVARSQAQIQADMHRKLTGQEAGLLAYWAFDDATGSLARDATSNANDGTLGSGNPSYQPRWVPSAVPALQLQPGGAGGLAASSQEQFYLQWTVQNLGQWPAQGPWRDRLYLSPDPWFSLGNIFLGEAQWNRPVAAGASYTNSIAVALPSVPSGTYYLIVRADGADELAEANEDNNTGNLNVSLGPTNCVSGSLQPIAWWPADGNTRDAVGSNDAALQGLAGFGLGEVGLAFTGLDGQANYVRVPYSDTFNLLGKSHTMENWVRIHRVGNLVLLTPMQAGGIGGLWYRNDGLMEAEVWFAPTDRRGLNFWRGLPTDVWLHVAQVFDASSSALFIYVNGTLAGSGINWSDQPDFGVNNPILFGKGYTENDNGYTFLADYDEIAIYDRVLSAAEIHSIYAAGSRGRKCWPSLVIPLAISNPDLLPTNLLAPASAPPSSTIEVAWTVANQGVGLANPPWVDRIYLSTDQVLDTSDRLLAEVPHGQPLLGGTNYAQVQTVSLSGVAEGTYYLLLVADAGNAVLESSETNNLQALRIEVRSPAVVQTVLRSLSAADAGFGNLGSLDFSPDGVQLTVAAGSTALIWDVQTGELRRRYYDHRGPIDTVDFSPAGDQVLSGARDGTARVWDADTRRQFRSFAAVPGEADPAVFSGDAARVLAGSGLKLPRLWDLLSGNELTNFLGHTSTITAVALSPDGATALTGSADQTAILWDTATGARLHTLAKHSDVVNAVAFSPDGAFVLTASSDGSIRIWNVADGTVVTALYQGNPVHGAKFSADGKYVVSYDSGASMAYLWEIASRSLVCAFSPPAGEQYAMTGVAISPDRTVIAASHTDGRIRLWPSGLEAIPLHSVKPLALQSANPLTLRSHGVQYFELATEPGHNMVIKVEPANNGTPGLASLSTQGKQPTTRSAADWQRLGVLSSDVQFANLGPIAAESQDTLSATSAHIYSRPSVAGQTTIAPLTLPSASAAEVPAIRVVAGRGQLPSAYKSDLYAQAPTSTLQAEIPVANTAGDKFYVLVFSPYLAQGAINISVSAEYTGLHFTSLSPTQGGDAGELTTEIRGTGFTPDTAIKLQGAGGITLVGRILWLVDATRMFVTFDLRGAVPGAYQLNLEQTGYPSVTCNDAFVVTAGIGPVLQAKLSAPAAVRPGLTYSLTLDYENKGDADMAAPLFILSSPQNVPVAVPRATALEATPSAFETGPAHVLGINPRGPAGVLPPGSHFSIPIYFQALAAGTKIDFNLAVAKADSTPIDWTAVGAQMKPANVDPAAWSRAIAKFKTRAGDTWSNYCQMLDNVATRLSFFGRYEYAVNDLLSLGLPQPYGLPFNTVSGVVSRADTAEAVPLVEVVAWNENPDMIRWTMTDWAGRFSFDDVLPDRYQLSVEGYYPTELAPITVADGNDVTSLSVSVLPVDKGNQPAPQPEAVPNSAPALAAGKDGELHLVWKHGNEIWHAVNTGGGWAGIGKVADAEGLSPKAVYGSRLFNGDSPGLMVVWQSGEGNETKLYCATGTESEGSYVWNAARQLTFDSYGDTAPAVALLQSGLPVILWLQRDFSIEDDDDLYYQVVAVSPGGLAHEPNRITPAGPIGSASPGVGRCWSADFASAKVRIPVIDHTFGFKGGGEVCFSVSDCTYTGSGEVGVSTELGEYTDVAIKCAAEARMVVRPKSLMLRECETVLDYLKIGPRIEGTFHIPYPPLTFKIPYFSVEAGLRIVLSGGGDLVWKGENFSWWPPNEATLQVGLGGGPYGKVKWWSRYFEIYGEISGTVVYTMPPGKWGFDGIMVKACWEGNAHSIREVGGCWQFGPFFGSDESDSMAPARMAAHRVEIHNPSPQSRVMIVLSEQGGVPGSYTQTDTIHVLQGSGRIYEGTPVLADISADVKNDGQPAVATSSAGETLVAWTKDSADPSQLVGSSVVVAEYAGTVWTAPVVVDGPANFNSDPSIAFDSEGVPMVVWVSAPASVTLGSTIAEVEAAMNATDAMYSRRINGAWTPPQKVADLPGPDSGTVLAVGPARRCVTAWMNTGDAGADICAAIWDGAAWTPPAKLSSVSRCKDPAAGFVGDRPVVVWVQGRDGDPQTEDDLYLYQSIYDGQWSAPVLIAELAALANLDGGSAAGAQASVSTPKLASTLYQTSAPAIASAAIQLTGAGSGLFPPPEGCCGEEPQPPTPPTPPTDPGDNTSTTVVRPRDPNDKLGPAGVGPDHVVSTKDEIEYIIRFENATNATAPVQELVVVDYLDKNLDWTTLRFGNITYGDRVVTLPADALQYSLRDLPPTNSTAITGTTAGQMAVDLSVSFNPQTGRIEWRAKAIDTGLTNLPPADPLAGILPPENGTGRGNGHVTFSVKPRTDAPLGTVITNRASIVFDTEDPMDTPPVWNTLGDVEPHRGVAMAYLPSRVADLLANTSSVSRRVSRQTTSIASQLQANQGAWAAAFSAGGASAAAANQADNAKQGSGESESSSVVAAVDSGSTPGSSGQPPALLIRRLSNEVELSWPAALPDRHLEVAADLTASANWQPANKAPAMINGRFVVRVEYTNSARFYRLRK